MVKNSSHAGSLQSPQLMTQPALSKTDLAPQGPINSPRGASTR